MVISLQKNRNQYLKFHSLDAASQENLILQSLNYSIGVAIGANAMTKSTAPRGAKLKETALTSETLLSGNVILDNESLRVQVRTHLRALLCTSMPMINPPVLKSSQIFNPPVI